MGIFVLVRIVNDTGKRTCSAYIQAGGGQAGTSMRILQISAEYPDVFAHVNECPRTRKTIAQWNNRPSVQEYPRIFVKICVKTR